MISAMMDRLVVVIIAVQLTVPTAAQFTCFQPEYCRNGATCVSNGINQTCTCAKAFTGRQCETALPREFFTCWPNPCQNSGVCTVDDKGVQRCACNPRIAYGQYCEYRNPCIDFCKNDGVCYISRGNTPMCICKQECTGPQCDTCNNCFTTNSTVSLESGRSIPIQDLSIGDRVLSFDDDGRLVYSQVLMWMDRVPTAKVTLIELITENGRTFKATSYHLISVRGSFIPMKDVKVGDEILLLDQHDQHLHSEKVACINEVQNGVGVFAPLTDQGTIVVDGVAASCYAYNHRLGQVAFAPMKLMTKLGLSAGQTDGMHWYSQLLIHLFDSLHLKDWIST